MTSESSRLVAERHAGQDLIKWIALITMVLDHMRLAWPATSDLFVLGRLSFPLGCSDQLVVQPRQVAIFQAPTASLDEK